MMMMARKVVWAVLSLLAVFASPSFQQNCNATVNCIAPACRCMSTENPGGFTRPQTPQIIFLSFDGAITTNTIANYTNLLDNRINPNGCPVSATFFVYHEYNDYQLTNSMVNKGHEVASFSMSHSYPADSWASKPTATWIDEIGGMRTALAKFANIPASGIKGSRAPFLQSSGDATFQAMQSLSMLYDCSFPTYMKTDPPIWPYTMDFGLQHECTIEPCPKNSYPGIWTVPMISLTDLNGIKQSMADGFQSKTRQETYQYLLNNFNRHYSGNKAPFGIYLNANSWFSVPEIAYRLLGYADFLDYIGSFDDVYVVSISKGVEWMKNPRTLAQSGVQGGPFACPTVTPASCTRRSCHYEDSPVGERVMVSCVTCPDNYPWTGNPLGTS